MIILPYNSSVKNPLPESLIPINICVVQDGDIQPIATLYVLSKTQDQKVAKFFLFSRVKKLKKEGMSNGNYKESYLSCYRQYLKKELQFDKIKKYLKACGFDYSVLCDKPFLCFKSEQKMTPSIIEIMTIAEDIHHYTFIRN